MKTKRNRPRRAQPAAGTVPARGQQRGRRERAVLYWAVAVAAAAVVAYLNAFGNEFVLDDIRVIRDNERLRSLAMPNHPEQALIEQDLARLRSGQ